MKFYVNVLLCAFLVLIAGLFVVFFQLKEINQTKLFPAAMTSCPDNWAINPKTGNCIIPNLDVSGANLGTLRDVDPQLIYQYTFDTSNNTKTTVYSTNSVIYSPNGNLYASTPYISPITGQTVYYYPSNEFSVPFPAGYPTSFVPADDSTLKESDIEKFNEVDFSQWNTASYSDIMTIQRDQIVGDICAVKSWANSNNVAWDGVNNYNGPCAYS
jgi:hypothetical protein